MNFKIRFLLFFTLVMGQERSIYKIQSASDEYDKYTSVGNLGLTITNFGILGNGWNRMEDGSIHPSCEFKQHTEIAREQIEHFAYCGLWVGGIVNGQRRVSTAIVDGVFDAGDEGFELFAETPIAIRSSISSTTQDSMAQYYSPDAVSHQDMISNFKDYGEDASDNMNIGLGYSFNVWNSMWIEPYYTMPVNDPEDGSEREGTLNLGIGLFMIAK